jgi:hypothetical protein
MTTTISGISSMGSGASGVSENGFESGLPDFFASATFRVIAAEIAHAEARHQPVAALHFADTPVERVCRELHVGHDGREQVRDALVNRELEHLRVDEDHAHLPRLGL